MFSGFSDNGLDRSSDFGADLLMNKKKRSNSDIQSMISDEENNNTNNFSNSRRFSDDKLNGNTFKKMNNNINEQLSRSHSIISDESSSSSNNSVNNIQKDSSSTFWKSKTNNNNDTDIEFESPLFNNKNNNNNPFYNNTDNRYHAGPSQEDILNMKRDILYKFHKLERRGVKLPCRYTINDDLQQMKADLEMVINDRKVDESIKFQRITMMMAVLGIEKLNHRFDPIGAELDGWSEVMHEELDGYDDIFEELHEKYGGQGQMPPEIRLLLGVGGSALMFHISNKFSKSMPGFEQLFKNNPNLPNAFLASAMNQG